MPRARSRSGFTRLFEALLARIGVNETASRRAQRYGTLFHDFGEDRLLFACEGRNRHTVARFAEDLRAHGGDPERIAAVCVDMSKAYIAGGRTHLPAAAITFDVLHVIQLANRAVDAKLQPALNSRWTWLKDNRKWNARQIVQAHTLSRSRLEPFKRLANTLKNHLQGVLNAFDSRLSNGRVEGINSLIQAAKACARGCRTAVSLTTIAYLIAGKLVHLSVSPYVRLKPTTSS